MNPVTTSEGVFARSVRVIYILRHDEGGEESVIARGCVLLIGVKRGGARVGQRGNALYWTREE